MESYKIKKKKEMLELKKCCRLPYSKDRVSWKKRG